MSTKIQLLLFDLFTGFCEKNSQGHTIKGKKIVAKHFYFTVKVVSLNYAAYIIEAINHFNCDLRFIKTHFSLQPNAG